MSRPARSPRRRWLPWARGLAPLILLSGVLAACTGTTENVPPLLLAVGRLDPSTSQPEMVLVEDNFTANQSTPRTLTVVPNSARTLAYPAVSADVVDRTGTRSTLVVLTRQLSGSGATTDPVSALRFYAFQGIDPASPTAFQLLRTVQLTGASGDPFYQSGACFTSVQISYDGRYAALLSDPQTCAPNSGNPPALYSLDTQNTSAHYQIAPNQPLLAAAPFDDQAQVGEKLYFLISGGVGGASNAEIWSTPVPYDPTAVPPIADTQASLPGLQQTELTNDGSQFVALTNQNPYQTNYMASYLEAVTPGTSITTGQQVATVNDARAMAIDPSGATQQVVVAGYYGSTGFGQTAVHPDPTHMPTATTPYTYGYTGVAAAIDPVNRFGYVVNDNQIVVLDLLSVTTDPTSLWYKPFSFSPNDLQLPQNPATGRYVTALDWTRAKSTTP